MDSADPISDLGLGCPSNGTFYICKDSPTQFIGCCTSNPCGDRKGLCPDEHLEPATFKAQYRIPPQACINDNFAVSWYTCPKTSPPFLGCCAVDPCSRGGCPDKELRAAKLSDKSDADLFAGGISPGSDTKSSRPAKIPITTATLTASYISTKTIEAGVEATSTLGSASPGSHPSEGKKGISTDALIGTVIGTFFASLFIGVIITCLCRRHKKRRFPIDSESPSSSRRWTPTFFSKSSSQKGPTSPDRSIYGITDSKGHLIGIEGPATISFVPKMPASSYSGEHPQQEPREGGTEQPQPGQYTQSWPNFPTGSPVSSFNTGQLSVVNPSMPQPPQPLSIDRHNPWDQGAQAQPRGPVHMPWPPSVELPTNTETAFSTDPLEPPIRHPDENTSRHEPEPRRPEFYPRPPTTRPGTEPLGDIPEEQSADHPGFGNTLATRLERQLDHDQSESQGEQQDVANSGRDSRTYSDLYDGRDFGRSPAEFV